MNTTTTTKALQAARECIHADRTSFADCSIGPGNTMEPDDAEALAEYDAVLAQVDEALAALQPQPAADWRDRLTVNLMRQGAGLTKTQIRALIAYAHDGIEPDPALFEQPAAAVSDEEISRLWSWSATAEAERTATTQQHAFAYALLALRPQAGPMTDEQSELEAEVERLRGLLKLESLRDHSHQCLLCLHPYTPLENQSEDCPSCGFDGITAQGAQGEQA